MFKSYDNLIESMLRKRLYAMKSKLMGDILILFRKENPSICREQYNELCIRMAKEEIKHVHVKRVCPYDQSIENDLETGPSLP